MMARIMFLYRVAENRDDAEQIAAKIYNYEIDENGFRQVTRSLHPMWPQCMAGKLYRTTSFR